LGGADNHAERQDHQREADHDASRLLHRRRGRQHEKGDPGNEQNGNEGRKIEGQRLHDERRANVGAEHHRERGAEREKPALHERDHDKGRGRRALDGSRDGDAGQAGPKRAGGGVPDGASKPLAEGAQHAGLDHARRPEEQGDAAEKVEQDAVPGHRAAPFPAPAGWEIQAWSGSSRKRQARFGPAITLR
jgi:hypothetical protein